MNFFKKITTIAFVTVFLFGTATSALAAPQWNTHPGDLATVASKIQGASSYGPTTYAQAGDKVAVRIYYHNTGTGPAANTTFYMSMPSGSKTTHTITGSVGAPGTGTKSGSTTIQLSSAQTLTYIPGSLRFYRYNQNQVATPVNNDASIFNSGLNVGTIPGMETCPVTNDFCEQGTVAVAFQVGNTTSQSYQCNDGYDNDGDGYTDYPNDPGCSSSTDNNEYNSTSQSYQCNDGYDNDGDGYTDYPNDPGCSSSTDNSEHNAQSTCKIDSFYASPTSVVSGGTTRLYWSTTNCTNVTIDGIGYSVDGNGYFGPLYSGRTYTINAYNNNSSDTENEYVSVNNNNDDECEIDSFYASPTNVVSGGTTRLYWSTTDCTNVTIDGVAYSVDGNGYFGPLYSGRTYTINAYNNNSSDSDSEYVSVNQPVTQTTYQCNDGYDNDGDGRVDMNDAGCSSYTDNDEYNYIAPVNTVPSISTLNPSNLTANSGRINGTVFNIGNGTSQVYFEWGTDSVNLPNKTSDQTINSSGTATFFDTLSGLSTSTTYYYRAVARSANGTIYRGEVKSFRLIQGGITTIFNRPIVNTVVTQAAPVAERGIVLGLGTNLVQLRYINNNQFSSNNGSFGTLNTVDNAVQNVCVDDTARFVIEYRNISNTVLTNAILHIDIPKDVDFRSSSAGVFNKADNTITVNVGTLNPDQSGTISFDGVVLSSASNRDLLVVPATLSFENPNNGARETAIAYGLATTQNCLRDGTNLAGFALGSGFFPNTLFGWLLLALVLIALIYLIRRWFMMPPARYADKRHTERHYEDLDVPTAPYRH
jgi:hypothetical protein